MKKYHYATLPAQLVHEVTRVPIPDDAYLARDPETDALKELLDQGYRWIRTESELAIFEKEIERPPRAVLDALNEQHPKSTRPSIARTALERAQALFENVNQTNKPNP